MVKRAAVLKFLAQESERGRSVSYRDVAEAFGLSPEAACGHLARLWRDRLIVDVSPGRRRFKFRLEPGESVMHLDFRLTERGWKRLRWYERHWRG